MSNYSFAANSSKGAHLRALIARHYVQARIPIIIGLLAALAGLGPVLFLNRVSHVSILRLTRDIFASTGEPFYVGLLSNLGLFAWAAAAALWLIGALMAWRSNKHNPLFILMIASGLFTLLLLFDDAFMLHEDLLPRHLGISEHMVELGYVVIAASYLVLSFRPMLRTPLLVGLIAGCFLALSFAADAILPMTLNETMVEDILKFVGIVFWMIYAAVTALQIFDEQRQST